MIFDSTTTKQTYETRMPPLQRILRGLPTRIGYEQRVQPNAVVQGGEVGEAKETAAGNQKKVTLTVIPPTHIENQRLNTGKSLLTRDAQKGNGSVEGGTKKEKDLGRFKSGHKKR